MELTLNGIKINAPAEVSSWQDLLDWVENQQVHPGHCISRVRLNGVQEVHFRQPLLLTGTLKDIGCVEIECGELGDVIRGNLSELHSELILALEITQSIVHQLSNRAEPAVLVQLIQALKSTHVLFMGLSRNLGWMGAPDVPEVMGGLEAAIAQLNVVQEDLIHSSICEILERDVAPVLESCHDTVEQTRVRIG